MNQIQTVKDRNPFRDPQGNLHAGEYLVEWHVYVEEELITFTLRFTSDPVNEESIVAAIKEINDFYPGVGWEGLDRFNY